MCEVPAFIGCYPFDPQMPSFVTYERLRGDIDEMAIEICTNMCNQNRYEYAGLEDGSRCYCGNNAPLVATQSEKTHCLKPCNDDDRQSCGGVGHIAIYESKSLSLFNVKQLKDNCIYSDWISMSPYANSYMVKTLSRILVLYEISEKPKCEM